MRNALILLLASVAAIRGQAAVASSNYGAPYNGIGAVGGVLGRNGPSPATYRVLVPLLLRWVPERFREAFYEVLLVLGVWGVLWQGQAVYGLTFSLILAALLPFTFRFDYWDWIVEMGAFMAAMTGRFDLALGWAVPMALSKETAFLVPVIWAAYGGDPLKNVWLLAILVAVRVGVLRWQGPRERERLIEADRNGADLRWWLRNVGRPALLRCDMVGTLVISGLTVGAALHLGDERALPWLLLLGAGWVFAIALETRVFAALLLPIVGWLVGQG